MNQIKIDTGLIEIPIVRDGADVGSISFNPNDVSFVSRFYELIGVLEKKEREIKLKQTAIEKDQSVDKYGIPTNAFKKIKLNDELCDFMNAEFDKVFGQGTCSVLFGNTKNPNLYYVFIDQLLPLVKSVRETKLSSYLGEKSEVLE